MKLPTSPLLLIATCIGLALALVAPATRPTDAAAASTCLRIVGGVFDAPGVDDVPPGLNGEYVVVRNACGIAVRTAGWSIADFGRSNVFTFPPGLSIMPEASVVIRSGSGRNTASTLYWGRVSGAVWNNSPGERAYLFNPAGVAASSWALPPPPAPAARCRTSLQALINAAKPGATVAVPACIYREIVTIDKPVRLVGRPGAEIRGSDVWTGWTQSGPYWLRGSVPSFPANGQCRKGSERCHWPEQVFLDGRPLVQVAGSPAHGQFAVNARREILLADDPTGRLVEVTMRTGWLRVTADDVTITGFRMRHAATNAQHGAIESATSVNRLTVIGNVLSDAHGALVSFQGGKGNRVIRNELLSAGQLGIHLGGSGGSGAAVLDNLIYGNGTEEFDPGWEAGGIKAAGQTGLTISRNEVWGNRGPGMWCDVNCQDSLISANRVHHNEFAGIAYEISLRGRILGNWVWENGEGYSSWVGGAGILCNVCADTEIRGNIVAWNADGIGVQSQNRGGSWRTVGVSVTDNVILSVDRPNDPQAYALGWVQDYPGPLFDPAAGNSGRGNRYWYPTPEGVIRFEWHYTPQRSLEAFNATPGEEGGSYLTAAEKDRILRLAGMPLSPEPN